VPILDAPLRDGAMLTLGRTTLRFDVGAPHEAANSAKHRSEAEEKKRE
jgi:hypothetical protein